MFEKVLGLSEKGKMRFVSTRGGCEPRSFSDAVSEGLAPDGGLFVPESLPDISGSLDSWAGLPYSELCFEFMRLFADDIPEDVLYGVAKKSYSRFDVPEVAPLRKLDDSLYLLELYHGPTLAFKDFALQFLGNLYEHLLSISGRKINVLGATSGDTGSAAISGLLGKKNVNIFILYPDGKISPLQERQMTCTGASNVFPIAIDGSFDDAQAIVKSLFGDLEFKRKYGLSAVNSINLARILAQCVYYIYAWLKLPKSQKKVKFIVPTGNFGNVLAGWIASKCGLPDCSFRVATNRNDILYRLFNSGTYELGELVPSCAPSMDIQVASNFERFIWYLAGADAVRSAMEGFSKTGKWEFKNFRSEGFSASRADDSEIERIIADVYKRYGAVVDPHTACAFKDLSGDGESRVILSTAHPAKFPVLVGRVLGKEPKSEILDALKSLRITRKRMPAKASDIREYIAENAIK